MLNAAAADQTERSAPRTHSGSSGVPHRAGEKAIEAPLYFSSAGRTLFGWLCVPSAPAAARIGLVICKPFGYEAICSHRSMGAFARAAAALGVPSLRFDYAGTGDSEDIDPSADQIQVWKGDIRAAVTELRRRTAVDHVCLLGFRLGALLAAIAAAEIDEVTDLIAIAPVISGRQYLRELRRAQRAAARKGHQGPLLEAGVAEVPNTVGEARLAVGGFSLAVASVSTLSQLDLMEQADPPVPNVLVIDRTDLRSAHGWTEAMSALGAQVRYLCLPGFVEMMMTQPNIAMTPTAMISVTREWLQLHRDVRVYGQVGPPSHPYRGSDQASTSPPTAGELTVRGVSLMEHAVFFGSHPRLFGIVTEPAEAAAHGKAVVLLNDGASQHVNSNRLHVELARRWGQRGCLVLRMDLAGLGDSETRPGRPDDEVFPPAAVDDVRAAVQFLRNRYGVRDITLAGVCSGAYHSFRAALRGLPLSRIMLINPLNFSWEQGQSLDEVQVAEVVRNPGIYRERLWSVVAWKKLLSGQTNVWRIFTIYVLRSALALVVLARKVGRLLRIRLSPDLGDELRELVARGLQIVFVFAEGEAGIELLRIQGGWALPQLRDRCRVYIVDDADHGFSRGRAREKLAEVLTGELFGDYQLARSPTEPS